MYDDILGPRQDKPKEPRTKINLHEGNCAPDSCGPDCDCNKPEEEEEISLDEALKKALDDIEDDENEDPWDGADEDIDEDLDIDIGELGEDDGQDDTGLEPSQDIGC